ncbi:hypothetical protein DBZ36_13415 [Alginatibacterium sediminis]|uniref:L,D-TPase catalytic domain-containing protein n=1 Tax=Alginatibacterium sediminis TaxID=2164068 RepID=A0A420EA59_9ALTE|nr:hypothetical protein DBZ36_13415 [Alginatibacterium sediminis]
MPKFVKADVDYPPKRVMMLASKQEQRLELWADSGEGFKKIHTYAILHASGVSGPKLVEGDLQVPEGLYDITALNPNSNFHLSMKINYPNDFDKMMARQDGRHSPGSNIFIHGKASSKGCLAMGDQAIEDLFILAERTGIENIKVAIAPRDPRRTPLSVDEYSVPDWTKSLYEDIQQTFDRY